MNPIKDAWIRWGDVTDEDPDSATAQEAHEFIDTCTNLDTLATVRTIETGALLWETEPRELSNLTEVTALHLAESFIANYRAWSETADDIAAELRTRITGVFETEREAAYAAVQQLGGSRAVRIQLWKGMALADSSCPQMVIDDAKMHTVNCPPGVEWHYVLHLGYITYRLS